MSFGLNARPADAQPLPGQEVKYPPEAADMAVNHTSQFAWELFVPINRKAPPEFTSSGGTLAVFQTWIDDPTNFPTSPDPEHQPEWPRKFTEHRPMLRSKVEASQARFEPLRARARAAHGAGTDQARSLTATEELPILEVVYRNYQSYKYIIDNKLWYQEGVADAFKKAAALAQEFHKQPVNQPLQVIDFPRGAIEVKSNWKVITEDQKKDYHWHVFPASTGDSAKPVLRGLVAMHISSKILPQWFWATFEHVDNPERSDYMGSYDDFGVTYADNPANPAYQPPRSNSGLKYSRGEVTEALIKLFKETGYEGDYLDAYRNYRLKGAQIDFTTSSGLPTLLGNSITESGFVPTSSCITCHSRAAVDTRGRDAFPLAGFQPFLLPSLPNNAGTVPSDPNRSFYGPPDPDWFWHITTGVVESGPNANDFNMKFYELKYLPVRLRLGDPVPGSAHQEEVRRSPRPETPARPSARRTGPVTARRRLSWNRPTMSGSGREPRHRDDYPQRRPNRCLSPRICTRSTRKSADPQGFRRVALR